jgi:hypothetical protein
MRKYHHQKNIHKKHRRTKKLFYVLAVVFLIVIGALAYAGYMFWQDASKKPAPIASEETSLGVYEGAPQKTVSNEVFEFRSSRDWTFSNRSSEVGKKYEYISQRNTMTDYVLTIYIGEVPTIQATSYLVPVEVVNNQLVAGEVSPHCKTEEDGPGLLLNEQKEYQGIPYLCNRETNQQIAMIGVEGLGTYAVLSNSDGEERQVSLVFEDVSGKFRPDAFMELIKSFKLR